MSLLDRLRRAIRGIASSQATDDAPPDVVVPPVEPGDGHAPGHRHLGPPPATPEPPGVDPKQPSNQPWVRTTQSDSQQRRPRG